MTIDVAVRHALPALKIDIDVKLGGGLTALVGPSGSGKTTLLNVIAGLVRADHQVVRVDQDVLADSTKRIWQPPHRRGIGYVFQEPRLFPHLTVAQNLAYGRWFRTGTSTEAGMDEIVDLLQLRGLMRRRPGRLSGGEKQRVALGRALLARPRLLLLDEPLASVDRGHRQEILPYLDRFRAAHTVPAIYVTHSWSEVETRADHVVVFEAGHAVFAGLPRDAGIRP